MSPVTIRQARPEDASVLFEMYKNKADIEGLADRFQVSVEDIAAQISRQASIVLIAFLENEPAGFANYYFKDSTFRGKSFFAVDDLYTVPKHERKGVAKNLLAHIANLAADKNYLMGINPLSSNTGPLGWYERLGAKNAYTIDWMEIEDLPGFIENLGLKV